MKYVTYILYSSKYNRYYIGHTNNLKIRLGQHNKENGRFWTKTFKPWLVIYQNKHDTRSEAIKEEKYLKSLKNKQRIQEYIIRNYKLRRGVEE